MRNAGGVGLLLSLLLTFVPLAGCGGDARSGASAPPPSPAEDDQTRRERERQAQAVMEDMDARISAWNQLPPAEREREGRSFGPEFERVLAEVHGTTSENKALLWLANWRLHYQNGAGVLDCLNRLDSLPTLRVKGYGEQLRVLYLVHVGDLAEARRRAESLVARIPDWSWLLQLIALHERIGQAPPITAGTNISGGPADPATRPEPYLLYCFTDALTPDTSYWFSTYLEEAQRPEYQSRIHVVLVSGDTPPLALAARVRQLPGGSGVDVLWSPPNHDGTPSPLRSAWQLYPGQCAAVILGPAPHRLILDVPSDPVALRVLLSTR